MSVRKSTHPNHDKIIPFWFWNSLQKKRFKNDFIFGKRSINCQRTIWLFPFCCCFILTFSKNLLRENFKRPPPTFRYQNFEHFPLAYIFVMVFYIHLWHNIQFCVSWVAKRFESASTTPWYRFVIVPLFSHVSMKSLPSINQRWQRSYTREICEFVMGRKAERERESAICWLGYLHKREYLSSISILNIWILHLVHTYKICTYIQNICAYNKSISSLSSPHCWSK